MPRPRALTRVALVEDHALFAESLDVALTLEGYDVHRIPVSPSIGSASLLLPTILRAHPHIVLLDLDLGSAGNGARLIEPLTRSGVFVAVVTASAEAARWGECLRYGARTVLCKTSPLNSILSTVRRLNEGLPVMSREERESLLRSYQQEKNEMQLVRLRLEELTPRERDILGHLMEGHAVRDIARMGVVSEATVRTQVKSILAKLNVSSQLAAVGAAHHVNWHPMSGTRRHEMPDLGHAPNRLPS